MPEHQIGARIDGLMCEFPPVLVGIAGVLDAPMEA